MSIATVDV